MRAASTFARFVNRNLYDLQQNGDSLADFGLRSVSVLSDYSTDCAENFISRDSRTIPQRKEVVAPPTRTAIDREIDFDATVIQLWEGRVLSVDLDNEVMSVLLTAKIGEMPEHSAEIELQWVSEQDRDLVVPGAVFYLTLYKKTQKGSIKNSQELRFRRRPSWTKQEVQRIHSDAEQMLKKMRPRLLAR